MVVSSLSTFSVCSFWHSFFSIENFIFEKLFTAARYLWKVTYHFSIIVINWPFLAGLVVHGQLDGYSGCFLVASFSPYYLLCVNIVIGNYVGDHTQGPSVRLAVVSCSFLSCVHLHRIFVFNVFWLSSCIPLPFVVCSLLKH